MKHIEDTLSKIRELYVAAHQRIEFMKPGQRMAATLLADELARIYGTTGPQIYPVLSLLLKEYPGIKVKRGPTGGIIKLDKEEIPTPELEPEQEQELNDGEPENTLPIINT